MINRSCDTVIKLKRCAEIRSEDKKMTHFERKRKMQYAITRIDLEIDKELDGQGFRKWEELLRLKHMIIKELNNF